MRSFGLASLAFAAASLCASAARGQVLLERFEPAERGSRFFVADSLELDGDRRLAAGVVMSYGDRLRTFRQSGGDAEASDLVVHSLWIHPGASLVLAPGARLALDMPVALQSGNDVSLDGIAAYRPASPRLGDLRGSFNLRLAGSTRPDVDGLVVAGGVSVYLPTGSAADYASDDVVRFDARIAAAARMGRFLFASRVGYMYRRDDLPTFAGVSLGSEANVVLAAGYRVDRVVLGPELYGSTTLKDVFLRRSTPGEALLGLHYASGDARFGAGIGTLLVSGLGAPKLRGVLSVEWAPSVATAVDRDHDGVVDADDLCPDVAGPGDPVSRGCPPPPIDTDHDGIFDADDACPQISGARTGNPKTHGCPAGPEQDGELLEPPAVP